MRFLSPKIQFLASKTQFLTPKIQFLDSKTRFLDSKIQFLDPEMRFLAPEIQFLNPKMQFLTPEMRPNGSEIDLNASEMRPKTSNIDSESSKNDFLRYEIILNSIKASPYSSIFSLSGTLRFSFRTGVNPKKRKEPSSPSPFHRADWDICTFNKH